MAVLYIAAWAMLAILGCLALDWLAAWYSNRERARQRVRDRLESIRVRGAYLGTSVDRKM